MSTRSAGGSRFGRPSSRIRLGSSHRSGLGLKLSHRRASRDWTAPDKDATAGPIYDRPPKGGHKAARKRKRKRKR